MSLNLQAIEVLNASAAGAFDLTEEQGELTLNMGPHHPSTHGVLRFVLKTDGEVMRKAIPDVGFLHRGIEKIGEKCTFPGFMPYTDRVDYLAAMFCNHVYARAVEKLTGIEAPPRAQYLRVVADEMNRIASHIISIGSMAMDLGATTPFLFGMREREVINNLIEELCGARLTYNYVRIGGVCFDLPARWKEKVLDFLDSFEVQLDQIDRLIGQHALFIERMGGVAAIPGDKAISWGLVGPNLRASGVDFDLRRDRPYSVYPELEFKVIVGDGRGGAVGDCYDRFVVRVGEMRESARILRQCLRQLPPGATMAKVPKKLKPPVTDIMESLESARGEMNCVLVSSGAESPWRVRFRTGSTNAMQCIEEFSRGLMIADLVALVASLDVIAPEVDR